MIDLLSYQLNFEVMKGKKNLVPFRVNLFLIANISLLSTLIFFSIILVLVLMVEVKTNNIEKTKIDINTFKLIIYIF